MDHVRMQLVVQPSTKSIKENIFRICTKEQLCYSFSFNVYFDVFLLKLFLKYLVFMSKFKIN